MTDYRTAFNLKYVDFESRHFCKYVVKCAGAVLTPLAKEILEGTQ